MCRTINPEGKDLLPPRLTSEGARVDPNWLLRFLHDPSLSEAKGHDGVCATATTNAVATASPTAVTTATASERQSGRYARSSPDGDRWEPESAAGFESQRSATISESAHADVQFFAQRIANPGSFLYGFVRSAGTVHQGTAAKPLTEEEKLVARQMFTSGTPCLKCHITGDPVHDEKAIAPNFLLAGERLKPEWTFRWLLDPAQIRPWHGDAERTV